MRIWTVAAAIFLLAACESSDDFYWHPPESFEEEAMPETEQVMDDPQPEPVVAPTLEYRGDVTRIGQPDFTFNSWGIWGKRGNSTLFGTSINTRAVLSKNENDQTVISYVHDLYVTGRRSGTNPTVTATWSGGWRAYDTTDGTPSQGRASLTANISETSATVAANLVGVGSWSGLGLSNGRFAAWDGDDAIEGSFYGDRHEGAAGKFTTSDRNGVFGALRQ